MVFKTLQFWSGCRPARIAVLGLAGVLQAPLASGQDIVASPEVVQPYQFSLEDEALLEAIERGCFQYLWREVGAGSGLAKDRRTTLVASVGGVGFQLSALPIGVERRWITRREGEQRALSILRTLAHRRDNRKRGVYLHFVHADTGAIFPTYNNEASTIDHALLLAGALTSASYFGGEVAELAAQMAAETNWRAYAANNEGFICFGWRPADNGNLNGDGDFMPLNWHLASDEERLIYFLAAGSPTPEFVVEPDVYYRLQRTIERHADMPPYVVSWNGGLFTYFFSHSWIDYRSLAADDPRAFGAEAPRVDWFENSRRAVLTHRQRCIEAGPEFATLAPDRWGLSPCMGLDARGADSYLVQEVQPNLSNSDVWQLGTVAPYAAGSAIVFAPVESLAALRAFRELRRSDGMPLVWRDPAQGGYGFADSFNLDQQHASDDNVAIDVGPMLLAIENARTGLVWRLFMEHEVAKAAVDRLQLRSRTDRIR